MNLLNSYYTQFIDRIQSETQTNLRLLYAIGKTSVFNEMNRTNSLRLTPAHQTSESLDRLTDSVNCLNTVLDILWINLMPSAQRNTHSV
jgi:hypothetical protein